MRSDGRTGEREHARIRGPRSAASPDRPALPSAGGAGRRCPRSAGRRSATIRSPSRTPARAPGLSGSTDTTSTALSIGSSWKRTTRRCSGTFCPATPRYDRRTRPSRISFADHEAGGVDRDREADALRRQDHRGVHADHPPARVDQRPARVARVERRVGLDDVVDQPPRLRAQRAAERADHAGRHRAVEAERVADRDGELADAQRGESPKRDRRERCQIAPCRRMTARSVSGSSPTRWRRSLRPSSSVTVMRFAPLTTWLLVSTKPSGVSTKPEPLPTASAARAAGPGAAGASRLRPSRDVDADDGRADRGGDRGHRARVAVEQRVVGRWGRWSSPSVGSTAFIRFNMDGLLSAGARRSRRAWPWAFASRTSLRGAGNKRVRSRVKPRPRRAARASRARRLPAGCRRGAPPCATAIRCTSAARARASPRAARRRRRASVPAAIEGLEDARLVAGREARAAVAHLEHDGAVAARAPRCRPGRRRACARCRSGWRARAPSASDRRRTAATPAARPPAWPRPRPRARAPARATSPASSGLRVTAGSPAARSRAARPPARRSRSPRARSRPASRARCSRALRVAAMQLDCRAIDPQHARQRRAQLVRHRRQQLALVGELALHPRRHVVERRRQHADLADRRRRRATRARPGSPRRAPAPRASARRSAGRAARAIRPAAIHRQSAGIPNSSTARQGCAASQARPRCDASDRRRRR